MLNGLDLFSGIGGLSVALAPWVRPIAYCENDRHAQAVLLSRIAKSELPWAPIWDDVRTLLAAFSKPVDIIYGGYPCQDISTMGPKKGLEGKRSGLFHELVRLTKEMGPAFVFLENVSRGIKKEEPRISAAFKDIGYTARAIEVSAFDVGANQERLRWFCLAHRDGQELRLSEGRREWAVREDTQRIFEPAWWSTEPGIPGVAHGVPARMDRHRALGNAVVPLQAREAFKRLMGLKESL